jgi:uncharacterized protein YjdB
LPQKVAGRRPESQSRAPGTRREGPPGLAATYLARARNALHTLAMFSHLWRAALVSLVATAAARGQDVTGLVVTPSSVRLRVGESAKLTVAVTRSDGTTAALQEGRAAFALSDRIATVDSTGRVTARQPGSGSIQVSYSSFHQKVPIAVLKAAGSAAAPAAGGAAAVPAPAAPSVPLRAVRSLRIEPLRMRLLPTERAHYTIAAEFDDGSSGVPVPHTVTVFGSAARLDSAASEVVGVTPGSATLGVRVEGGPAVSIPVEVVAASLKMDRDTLVLAVGATDSVVVATSDAQSHRLQTGLHWSSTNPLVIQTLDSLSGGVRAVSAGSGDIIVLGYGVTMRLPVVTYPAVRALRRTGEARDAVTIPVGLQATLGVDALADNDAVVRNVPLRWEVADSAVATYDVAHGTLVARRAGTTTVTVRLPHVLPVSWSVRVVDAKFTIAAPPPYLVIGESRQLRAVWLGPDGDTLRSSAAVTWRSSNARAVAVGDSGRISAAATGAAIIRADFGDRFHAEAPVRAAADFLVTLDYGRDSTSVAELSMQKRTIEPLAALEGARYASWAPNRDRLVFSRRVSSAKTFALFTSAPDGSDARPLSRPREGDDMHGLWFLHADRIAFLSGRPGDLRVAAQQPGDTLVTALADRGRLRGIARRRDTDEFFVIRETDGRFSVWVAAAGAPEKALVADRRGSIDAVAERADGSILMLADTSSGKDRFALVQWVNGQGTTLDVAFPNAGRLRAFALSADAQHAVVVADNPASKQGSVVFWVDLATRAAVEVARTDRFKVLSPRS